MTIEIKENQDQENNKMAFDPNDPFDAAALYDMWFNCSDCTISFDFDPGGAIGLRYYHAIGQEAKRQGWFVNENGAYPGKEPTYTVLCPGCTERMGLKDQFGNLAGDSTESLYRLCRSLEKKRVA